MPLVYQGDDSPEGQDRKDRTDKLRFCPVPLVPKFSQVMSTFSVPDYQEASKAAPLRNGRIHPTTEFRGLSTFLNGTERMGKAIVRRSVYQVWSVSLSRTVVPY